MLLRHGTAPQVSKDITHSVTIVPRLKYSVNLLDDIISILECRRAKLRETNCKLDDWDKSDKTATDSLNMEYSVSFSLEVLSLVKQSMRHISDVSSIPKVLPSSIPMLRTVSAQLFVIMPECSQRLSELSVHLGSIVLDSAVLATASFDFSQSNTESSYLLNKVKLIVNSKLNKQYPNLDFFRPHNTC